MEKGIDLNCDMGEGYGVYSFGYDEDLMKVITSANIACGAHAGDPHVMERTVKLAKENNVAIGAHPGYPDLAGFGRRFLEYSPEEIYRLVVYQIGSLQAFCQIHHVKMTHVKAHGALYNAAAKKREVADAIAQAVKDLDDSLILYGLAGSELIAAGKRLGLAVASEVFADRTYQADGTLTPRSNPNALIQDFNQAIEQVKQMVLKSTVTANDGTVISLEADTVCVHGDNPHAIQFASQLHEALRNEGIVVRSLIER
jgi:5-oxoprolinase (ATP-hydrolysing) subunit A